MYYGNINCKDLYWAKLKIFSVIRIIEVILRFLGINGIFGKKEDETV